MASTCPNTGNGQFCTFGYKWGNGSPFANAGLERKGPGGNTVVEITYQFQGAGYVFNTHAQSNLVSLTFDDPLQCAKQQVEEALSEWERVTNVKFIEKTTNETTDLRFIMANVSNADAMAYPAFAEAPCKSLAGQVVFKKSATYNCDNIFRLALHDVGHALGLGHVVTHNVMNPTKTNQLSSLQAGDIAGIQSIYGVR